MRKTLPIQMANPRAGYVYLAASLGSRALLKIGYTKGDPQKRIAQMQTGNPQGVRLVHAIAVPDPRAVERMLHQHFAAKRQQGEWFQVSVSEARRAMYAIVQHAAQIDAQRELDRFVNEAGGIGLQLIMYFVVMFLWLGGIYTGLSFGSIFDSAVFQFIGIIIGIVAAFYLFGWVSAKVTRLLYGARIDEKAREIEREYKVLYSVEIALE